MIGVKGRSGVTFTAEVRNQAAVSPNNDIAAVTAPKKNYKFIAYYWDGSGKVGIPQFISTPVFSDDQLRQELPAVFTSGAVNFFNDTK